MTIQINGNGTITGINVGGLPDGIVDTDMIAANAVATAKIADSAVTSAKASGLGGLTMAQEWAFAGYPLNYQNTTDLTSWNARAGNVGSSMTHSSGVFTFPSTGIYQIHSSQTSLRISNESRYITIFTYLSTDSGSNWSLQKENYSNINNDASNIQTFNNQTLIDIQDTSTYRVKFAVASETTVSLSTTFVQFLKLGDT